MGMHAREIGRRSHGRVPALIKVEDQPDGDAWQQQHPRLLPAAEDAFRTFLLEHARVQRARRRRRHPGCPPNAELCCICKSTDDSAAPRPLSLWKTKIIKTFQITTKISFLNIIRILSLFYKCTILQNIGYVCKIFMYMNITNIWGIITPLFCVRFCESQTSDFFFG